MISLKEWLLCLLEFKNKNKENIILNVHSHSFKKALSDLISH